jgi:glycosyltransferase involved in cell wall biosynthesis
MKVLILANKMPYPPNDGGTIATLSMAKAIAKLGHQVTMLAMNTYKHNYDVNNLPDDLMNLIQFHTVDIDTRIKPPELLINLLFSRLPYNAKRFISRVFKVELIKLLENNSYDIVQLEGLYLYPYIPIIRKYYKGQIALRSHNVEHEIWTRTVKNHKSGPKKWYLKLLTRRMKRFEMNSLNKFDLLVPITERDGSVFEFLGNNAPTCVAPVGINIENYNFKSLEGIKPELAFIGALDWVPNQEGLRWFLKKVWPIILKHRPDAKFHIAGRKAPKNFEFEVKKQNVVYHGEVDDAMEYLSSCSFMIVPLLSGSGMRVKIIEGMAIGRVVFTTSIGAEGIHAESGKNIFIENNPEKFANLVVEVMSDSTLAKSVSNSAREFIDKYFGNEQIADKLMQFYYSQINNVKK